jgi:hypothetical protein
MSSLAKLVPLLPPATDQRQKRHPRLCRGANRNESIGVADYHRTVIESSSSPVSDGREAETFHLSSRLRLMNSKFLPISLLIAGLLKLSIRTNFVGYL